MKSKHSRTDSAQPTVGQEPSAQPAISSVDSLLNGKKWHVLKGDCIELMPTLPAKSIDFSVFSPPFPSLFSYTSEMCDIGNNEDLRGEAKLHLSWFYRQLARILKPGRVVMVHVMQIPGLARNGEKGTFDFRGLNIRLGKRAGLIYQYDWLVPKNPQAQAIRTHSHKLQFVSLRRDRAITCGAMPDYIIKFIAPGENQVPINSNDVSNNEWIEWAEAAWYGIRETNTLNTRRAKSEDDVKHICPLQLDVIDRCVRLYSNPGELIFSPFAGIGSEGVGALLKGRRFLGFELKDEYFDEAQVNLASAEKEHAVSEKTLFDELQEV
jgi:DNA modification methylase